MDVRLIQVAYHLGHERTGMGLGPVRYLEAGAAGELTHRGHTVHVEEVRLEGQASDEVGAVFELNRRLAGVVRQAVADGAFPLVLAGNCSSSLGILAGLAEPDIGIVWFDAHGDFNTPETTRSGFFDGMALAVATGRCWRELAASVPGFTAVGEERVLLVAARDLDPAERRLLESSAVTRVARAAELEAALQRLAGSARGVYLHLDLDALDPEDGRANAYAAAGGFSLAELEAAIGAVRKRFALRGAALTAYDPAADASGRACRAGMRLMQAIVAEDA
ncbi:MAG TPA: arginase family protein [Gemmatimonadota bacterium]|jgi:arginase